MLTVSELLKAAMRTAQVIRKGEEPDAGEMADALEAMTIMLHAWSARKLLVRANIPETFTLVANTRTYTIGVGGTFNTSKPYKIVTAFIRDTNNVDTPVLIRDMNTYQGISDKLTSIGRPDILVYDPGAAQQDPQLGTIYLYSVPDVAYTLGITSQKPFVDFTDLADDVTFDPPYEELIKYEMAVRLWPEYHKGPVPQDIHILANEAMHTVESMNAVVVRSTTDLPGVKGGGGTYDINVGPYSSGL